MVTLFLSYSRSDLDAVAPLVAALRAAGVDVFQDTSALEPFDPIHERIVEGLEQAAAVLAWYSKDYAAKRYCQWELTAAWLAGEAAGEPARRILVVNPEPGVDHIHPTALCDRLAAGPKEIADPAALARHIAAQIATLPGTLGRVRVPAGQGWYGRRPPANRPFIGRRAVLWQVHSGLKPGMVTAIRAAANPTGTGQVQVQGLGGVGKTMLAEEYALRFAAGYPGGVFWLSPSDGNGRLSEDGRLDVRLSSELDRLARDRLDPSALIGLTQAEIIARFRHQLRQAQTPYLWVLDDWPHGADARALEAWRAPGPAGHTLITTRDHAVTGTGRPIDLECLDPEEALALLARHRAPADDAERTAARAIAERLGGHPLALDVAGAVIRQQGYRWFLKLLDRSVARALALAAEFREVLPTGHEREIVTTLAYSLEHLDETGRDLLRLAAVLARQPIPNDLLADAIAIADGQGFEDAEIRTTMAINAARTRSLLTVGDGWVTVHGLIGLALDGLYPAPERTTRLRAGAVAALDAAFASHAPDIRAHATLHPLAPHAQHLTLAARDEPVLSLLGWLGRYDLERGAYPAAAASYREERRGRESLLGIEHPDTLTSMSNLAATLQAQGDLAGARELHEAVLALRRRVLGPEHPDTLTSMNNLAGTLQAQGDLAGARELQEAVLAHCRRLLGPEHPDRPTAMNNLASTLRAQGDLAGARELQGAVLAHCRRLLGPEHPDTLTAMNNLASTLRAQGDLAGARELQEAGLALCRRVLGSEHPATLTSMNNLALTLRAQDDLAGARELQEVVLAVCRRVLGPEHPATLTSMNNLALTLRAQDDLAGGRELHEAVLALRRRVLGPEHPDTLSSMNNLATTLHAQGDLAGARELQEAVLALRRRLSGTEHPDTLTAMNNLASTLWAQGDQAGARELQEAVLALFRRLLGPEHPDTLTAMNNLASTLHAQGDLAGARELQEAVLALHRRVLGPEHSTTLTAMNNLAVTLQAQGDLAEARQRQEALLARPGTFLSGVDWKRMEPLPMKNRAILFFDGPRWLDAVLAAESLLQFRVISRRRNYIAIERTEGMGVDQFQALIDQLARNKGSRAISDFKYNLEELPSFSPTHTLPLSGTTAEGSLDDVLELIGATNLDNQSRGEGVAIAVIDTGVNGERPEFPAEKRAGGWCPEGDMPWTDENGHGTMCATIAAATRGPGGVSRGVAPDAKIISCKTGFYNSELGMIYDLLGDMARSGQVIVASNSFGVRSGSPPPLSEGFSLFDDALSEAIEAGVFVVFSAGNYHKLAAGATEDCGPNSIWLQKGRSVPSDNYDGRSSDNYLGR